MDETKKFDYLQGTQAGMSAPRPFDNQGVKCISGLTGEVYNTGDAQEMTDVQRAWLYSKDPSVFAMQKGKTDQRLKVDNALSLPLGKGEREHFELSDQPGYYRRKRCEITNIKNNVITKK